MTQPADVVQKMHETLVARNLRNTRANRTAYLIGYRDAIIASVPTGPERRKLVVFLTYAIKQEQKHAK